MEMDSHEERLHNMIQDSKREAAKEEAGRRAKELREKQKEAVSLAPLAGKQLLPFFALLLPSAFVSCWGLCSFCVMTHPLGLGHQA